MRPVVKTIRPPQLPKELEGRIVTQLEDVDIEGSRLEASALANLRSDRVRFDGVRVVGGSLSATKLARLVWVDVLCERCDLSLIDWPSAKLTRVEFRDCRLTGAKAVEGELADVRFVDCQLDYASFARARFRQVGFERCRLKEADLAEGDLAGTSFTECDLSRAST